MNIITIFNYPDEKNYNIMFKVWLYSAVLSKQKTSGINNIVIYSKELSTSCLEFIKLLNVDYIKVKKGFQKELSYSQNKKWTHNVGYKLFTLCNQTEPYIFIDADTLILTDMNDCVRASNQKPFIGVNHQTIQGHTAHFPFQFINTGFLIVSKPSFLDFYKILQLPIKYDIPGTDQKLIYNYCMTNKYDYTHELIHWGWNSCAAFKKEVNHEVVSHGIPENHKVHILHYWFKYKPWITPCTIFNQYYQEVRLWEKINEKIKNMPNELALMIYHTALYKKTKIGIVHTEYVSDCKYINIKGKNELYDKTKIYDFVV